MKSIALLPIVFLITSFTGIRAQIIHVPADEPTIQEGIAAADDGDTILVSPGTYVENINFWGKNITVASLLLTTSDTTYISQTIIDGNTTGSVVEIINEEDTTAMLCGFTIRNGFNDNYGGGINCFNASPRLMNLKIWNNSALYGGGISCRAKSTSDPQSHPYLCNLIIYDNSAQFGGGICLQAGITTQSGTLKTDLQNILLFDNNATRGGGIMIMGKSETTIQNITVTQNIAAQSGGGISSQDYPLTIRNAILWGNAPDEIFSSGSPSVTYSDIEGGAAGVGNKNEMPLFAGSGKHPFALSTGSPCIDAGTPDVTGLNLPPWDIIGNARIWDGNGDALAIIDMGAYEFGSKPDGLPPTFTVNSSPFSVHCYPNPFSGSAIIEIELTESQHIVLTLYDPMSAPL